MNFRVTHLILLFIAAGGASELCVAQNWRWDSELAQTQDERGFRLVGETQYGSATIYQWEMDEELEATVSTYVIGRNRVHFPDQSAFVEFKQLGVQQAEEWIKLDTARWHLTEQQQSILRLAAGLQMSSLERAVRSSLRRLEGIDLEAPDNRPIVSAVEKAVIEFLNPRFRAKESLYYNLLHKMLSD